MAAIPLEFPYDELKEMLLMDDIDNRQFLIKLFTSIYDDFPAQQKKKG